MLPAAVPNDPDSPFKDFSAGDINTSPHHQTDVSKVPGGESESLLEIKCPPEEKYPPLSRPRVHSLRNRTPEASLARRSDVSHTEATQKLKKSVVDRCEAPPLVSFRDPSPSWDRSTKGKNDFLPPPVSNANVENLAAKLGGLELHHW
jgi:hypothetical protein